MLDRFAIVATFVPTACAALVALLVASVDGFAPAPRPSAPHAPTLAAVIEPACTFHRLRTRAPGLHQRYLMRDLMPRRSLWLDD